MPFSARIEPIFAYFFNIMSRNPSEKRLFDEIFQFLHYHPKSSRSEIEAGISSPPSPATLKRYLTDAIKNELIFSVGSGRAVKYSLTPKAQLLRTIEINNYFKKEIDERLIQSTYNFELIHGLLAKTELFTSEEQEKLSRLHTAFSENISTLSPNSRTKEMERLGIDLSWKSSQIEGNTYTLLETERLLKENEEAQGRTKEEAQMLLNHKEALKFLLENEDYLENLSVGRIEDVHSLLIKNLNVQRNLRTARVGITGTNYRPLDNEFQIREALNDACNLINAKQNVFEKALLAILLISYIQPFSDGNKRTARIVCNALLLANRHCPLSFRTVDSLGYKEALLIFYEQNNLSAFKKIFIEQVEFAVKTYF